MWLTGDVPARMLAVGTNLAVVRAGGYENVVRIVGRGMQAIGNGAVYTGGQIIDGGQGLGEGMGMVAQHMSDDIQAIGRGSLMLLVRPSMVLLQPWMQSAIVRG